MDRARHGRNRRLVKHDLRRLSIAARKRIVIANIDAVKIDRAAHFVEIPLMSGQQIVDHGHALRARARAGRAPAPSR